MGLKCLRIHNENKYEARIEDWQERQLEHSEVRIEVHYSSLNYKDALAVTGKGKIIKKFPLVAGIDLSGIVIESNSKYFNVNDKVVVTGCDTGEIYDGGFSQQAILRDEVIVHLEEGLSLREAMIYGTAGFTAALCLERLELLGLNTDNGTVLVTGASGGVGSFASVFLKNLNFDVLAINHKEAMNAFFQERQIKVSSWEELKLKDSPLANSRFQAAIDNLGGKYLQQILAHTQLWGSVASVGLAADYKLETTVMPFILRGVSLLGISSNNCPRRLREKIWKRLATDLKPQDIEGFVAKEIRLEEIISNCEEMIQRKSFKRNIVKLN